MTTRVHCNRKSHQPKYIEANFWDIQYESLITYNLSSYALLNWGKNKQVKKEKSKHMLLCSNIFLLLFDKMRRIQGRITLLSPTLMLCYRKYMNHDIFELAFYMIVSFGKHKCDIGQNTPCKWIPWKLEDIVSFVNTKCQAFSTP